MFWSGEQIARRFPIDDIVSDYVKNRIDCNAYMLTVGDEYFITHDGKGGTTAGLQLFRNQPSYPSKGALIPSGQFAFLISKESVKIPKNAMGFISLKTKTAKFRGLVNISGFHVDPGYHGQLIFSVFNAGPAPIHVKAGDPLFMLWIADIGHLDTPRSPDSTFVKTGPPALGIPSEIVSQVSSPLLSLQDVSSRFSELKTSFSSLESKVAGYEADLKAVKSSASLFRNAALFVVPLIALGIALWSVFNPPSKTPSVIYVGPSSQPQAEATTTGANVATPP